MENPASPAADINFFAKLRERDLSHEGIMIAEGHLVAARLIEGPFEILAALCTPKDAPDLTTRLAARTVGRHDRGRPVQPQVLPEHQIAELAGYPFHRGVMVAARVPQVPGFATYWEQLKDLELPLPTRLILCPALNDAENLGVIYRCAAALGWDGLGFGPECTSPFSRRVLRVSMGNCLRLPSFCLDHASDFQLLKQHGFLVVGTSIKPQAMHLDELHRELIELEKVNPPDAPIRLALVFGNEFTGLTPEQENACHRLVTIPMHRGTDSLNVAVAAGIFMHELGPA